MDVKMKNRGYGMPLYHESERKNIKEEPIGEEESLEKENINESGELTEEELESLKSHMQKKLEKDQKHVQDLMIMTEELIRASKDNTIKEDALQQKKSIVENMLKTIRALNQTTYTRESYKKCMADVNKAVRSYRTGELSQAKLNKALNHLRTGLTKLKPAKQNDEKGKFRDANKDREVKKDGVKWYLKENGISIDGLTSADSLTVTEPVMESGTDISV